MACLGNQIQTQGPIFALFTVKGSELLSAAAQSASFAGMQAPVLIMISSSSAGKNFAVRSQPYAYCNLQSFRPQGA